MNHHHVSSISTCDVVSSVKLGQTVEHSVPCPKDYMLLPLLNHFQLQVADLTGVFRGGVTVKYIPMRFL